MALSDVVGFVVGHKDALIEICGAVLGVANLINGLVPGAPAAGVLGTIRKVIDRLSVLTSKDGANTLKLPGTASKPVETK